MTRGALARVLGVEAAVAGVLLMLAGSDWPPPRGFWLVVAACAGLGLLVAVLVPMVLRRADHGSALPALVVAAAGGAGYLAVLAVVLMLVSPADPSAASPGPTERVVFVVVAACVGWFGGAAVGVAALLADRARQRSGRLLGLLALPVLAVALIAVVGLRG